MIVQAALDDLFAFLDSVAAEHRRRLFPLPAVDRLDRHIAAWTISHEHHAIGMTRQELSLDHRLAHV